MLDNRNAEIWENIFSEYEWGKYPPLSVIRFIARNFYKKTNRSEIKVLEIGSGTGANLWFVAREGFTVYGVDFSATACSILHNRFRTEKLTNRIGEIVVGDYLDTLKNFPDSYFDAIIDIESLCCNSFEDTKKIIATCFSKLKTGGLFLSQTFNDKTWGLNGTEIDYHAVFPEIGPMAQKGFSRYTTKKDIEILYSLHNSYIKSIELQELHLNNSELISEWIVEVEKK